MSAPLSIVRASAGSGKTFTLALEYCKVVVERPEAYREILAVTFTNKATGEMKRRIIEELAALARGERTDFAVQIAQSTSLPYGLIATRAAEALSLILTDYSLFSVMTIDKFFQKIVRSFFRELGLDFTYQVEIQSNQSVKMAIARLIEMSGEDSLLRRLIERLVGERLDRGASWNVESELYQISPEIFNEKYIPSPHSSEELIEVLNGLKKDYDQVVSDLRALCSAACELITAAGLEASDFKYAKTSFAHYLFKISSGAPIVGYGKRFAALPDDPESAYSAKSAVAASIKSILPDLVARVAEIIALYDHTLVSRSTFEVLVVNFSRYLLLGRLKSAFGDVLAEQGKMTISSSTDFINQIAEESSVPFIFEKLGSRYSTIFIDEFQDTSSAQWQGFLPLLHEIIATQTACRSVMLIGDVKQAIYRWRGGDWDILGYKAHDEFRGSIEETEPLVTSYRSEAKIVNFNNSFISNILRVAQGLVSEFLSGERGELFDDLITAVPRSYADAIQKVAPNKLNPERGYVALNRYEDPIQAMEMMIEDINNALNRGYRAQDIAVLVRRGEEGVMVARALIEAHLPMVSDEVLMLDNSKAVNFVINVFDYCITRNAITLAAINHYLGRDFTSELGEKDVSFFDHLRQLSPIEAYESVIVYFNLQQVETAYLQELYEQIYLFSIQNSADISAFLGYWTEHLGQITLALGGRQEAITVVTIHKAKGLEFPIVLIPLASWSFTPLPRTRIWASTQMEPYSVFNPFPLNYTENLANSVYREYYLSEGVHCMVDNLNMLYVALTRARSELYVSIPELPSKNSIGLLIDAACEMMNFEGSVGEMEFVAQHSESTDIHSIMIDNLPSYPQRSSLDLTAADDSDNSPSDDLFAD
ncbi:MAG: UvrD-helicase domain-containing protein [Mucinivorans sp.]